MLGHLKTELAQFQEALIQAIMDQSEADVETLLQQKSNTDFLYDGHTPFCHALRRKSQVIKILLYDNWKNNNFAYDCWNHDLYLTAVSQDDDMMAQLLFQFHNQKHHATAMSLAMTECLPKVFAFLLKNNVSLMINNKGWNAFNVAIDLECADYLNRIFQIHPIQLLSSLQYTFQACSYKKYHSLEWLLNHEFVFDLNECDPDDDKMVLLFIDRSSVNVPMFKTQLYKKNMKIAFRCFALLPLTVRQLIIISAVQNQNLELLSFVFNADQSIIEKLFEIAILQNAQTVCKFLIQTYRVNWQPSHLHLALWHGNQYFVKKCLLAGVRFSKFPYELPIYKGLITHVFFDILDSMIPFLNLVKSEVYQYLQEWSSILDSLSTSGIIYSLQHQTMLNRSRDEEIGLCYFPQI